MDLNQYIGSMNAKDCIYQNPFLGSWGPAHILLWDEWGESTFGKCWARGGNTLRAVTCGAKLSWGKIHFGWAGFICL